MARIFPYAKAVPAFIANEFSAVLTRRGFASAAQGVASSAARNGAPTVMLKKGSEEAGKTPWVPDPVTGYYRPQNQNKELDPAELRELLINNKGRGH